MTAPCDLRIDLDNLTPQQQYYRDLSFAQAIGDDDTVEALLGQPIPPAQKRDGYVGELAVELDSIARAARPTPGNPS
ncbi:hypothetical protein [Nocardia tengchongensis]|uniref:hypothetical protein n=1 Tax=Nocardia tengchongensis TaxID=2055889 RepID=UPI0036994346